MAFFVGKMLNSKQMKLLIGLGNPGEKYAKNRHNAGAIFVSQFSISNKNPNIKAVNTDAFMNDSGKFVAKAVRKYLEGAGDTGELGDLYVAHDDLDLPLGQYKIQKGVGPKVHRGLQAVEKELGTTDFRRIRIGVDNRDPQNRTPGEEYVLEDFTKEEREILENVFNRIIEELKNAAD